MPSGNGFKFTGGEPTLNKDIFPHMKIIKNKQGFIYLDTNGSNPAVVINLLNNNLIDVLGVSLKGLTPESAENTAGTNSKLCWDNVWKVISGGMDAKIPTIITVVVDSKSDIDETILFFKDIIDKRNNIFIKINNLHINSATLRNKTMPANEQELNNSIRKIVSEHRDFVGKVIFVQNENGIDDPDYVHYY